MTYKYPNHGKLLRADQEAERKRKRPLFDNDRIREAHERYLLEKAENKEKADIYGIVRVERKK